MTNIDQYLEGLVTRVCTDLARIYSSDQQTSEHGLVFPIKRDGSLRISEQEAKLLFVQHLTVDRQCYFSVETPTVETYKQKGTTPMSARVDLTLLGPDRNLLAHIELKAHNCTVESIRKDLEKLLREKVTGVWFHTIRRANRRTLETLAGKFKRAFSQLTESMPTNDRSYLIAFFVLDSAVLSLQWLHLTGNNDHDSVMLEACFDFHSEPSLWRTSHFRPEAVGDRHEAIFHTRNGGTRGKGAREAFLVFAPKAAPDTFLHLSARGESYRIRKYDLDQPDNRPSAFVVPEYPTVDALRKSDLIVRWVPLSTADMKHSIDKEPQYWVHRICEANADWLSAIREENRTDHDE